MLKTEFKDLSIVAQQKELSRIVDENVRCNVTSLVEYALKAGLQEGEYDRSPLSIDNIINNDPYSNVSINGYWHQLTASERDEKLEFYEYLRDKAQNKLSDMQMIFEVLPDHEVKADNRLGKWLEKFEENQVYRLVDICAELENMDFDEQHEIYEWWACGAWFISKLEEAGEIVLEGQYWGRTCTGQAIMLDSVIEGIYLKYYE